ncbi:hypothetical protein QYE76_064679 [Lolium multiflorum]|uniref:CCHC-type domain-containing protein n=1 Tax=Lolium multiflorum TaxID=4521 RepID=A0AAD8S7A7_LOLMU|nr:hypothetical protein QYE76_064679 [Lolium multiflorum]
MKDPAKIVCFKCKIEGHHVRSCPLKKKPHGEKKQGKRPQDGAHGLPQGQAQGLPRLEERPLPKKDQAKAPVVEKSSEKKEKRRTCYICREKGHISSFCTIDIITWREYEALRNEMRREFRTKDDELKDMRLAIENLTAQQQQQQDDDEDPELEDDAHNACDHTGRANIREHGHWPGVHDHTQRIRACAFDAIVYQVREEGTVIMNAFGAQLVLTDQAKGHPH